MKGKGTSVNRGVSQRAVLLPVVLMLGIVLPFLFVRVAFLALESATVCSSSLGDCIGWRFFNKKDSSLLGEEVTRALMETSMDDDDEVRGEGIVGWGSRTSFNDIVKDTTSKRQDIKAFAMNTKAMMMNMERKVKSARRQESIYWHFASHGVPKSLHCLSLKLAEEYAVNAIARSPLPPPEFVSRLTDPSFYHVLLITDNVLAASTVISSTIKASIMPEKFVFHVVTDKKTYAPMHAWFAINSQNSEVVEVKGLHQYEWSHEVNFGVKEMLEIHRLIWSHNYENLKKEDLVDYENNLQFLSPSCASLLNHLRIYIYELFPDLNKIVFLDDDIVVQHDLSPLWEMDLNGKVVGAVVDSVCGHECCSGRKYKDYLNFTHTFISSNFDEDRCGWLYGMNIFDLEVWRKTNITATYHYWLKLNLNFGLNLWRPGALPPALLAFDGHVLSLDPSWHVAGLGHRFQQVDLRKLESAAVIHFSGPAKPWLEIGVPMLRSLWTKHVNFSNEFITKCEIAG